MAIPNSCFTVIFVDPKNFNYENTVQHVINVTETETYTLEGVWLDLGFKFDNITSGNETLSATLNYRAFVSSHPITNYDINGFIGVSPCYDSLKEYSFFH